METIVPEERRLQLNRAGTTAELDASAARQELLSVELPFISSVRKKAVYRSFPNAGESRAWKLWRWVRIDCDSAAISLKNVKAVPLPQGTISLGLQPSSEIDERAHK
ncbi:hypothetical protein W97_01899 [Coniosporium apollinis CBS 100218]|uniref:Uncharacterized protein n=1 Tax=Coniosporium apollinis (strain CBS 100218) TaxID=1168221 RepID=R7YL99_CONA1|nr:uncharacterized protein W97_01899 [Coniosporium apollinis CBS 100218]EON62675.1 hypothetical protein W97_01899 [Coniosporium apollinis CBS 100218]